MTFEESISKSDGVIARLPSEMGLLAISAARRWGKPYAIEVVTCPWDALWNYGKWQAKAYAPILAARTRLATRSAPFVIYVTKTFLQRRYPNTMGETAACSDVEIDEPNKAVLNTKLSRIKDAGRDRFVFGLIGTLNTRFKGIQTVLKALTYQRGQLPPVEFRILGVGDPEPWIREAESFGVSDIVQFDGTLPSGEAVFRWLDEIDVYLQPSFQEGLPRALIEAMSRGCPAIGSTCGGIPELLEPECLMRPGDARSLGTLMAKAALDPRWRRERASRNWEESRNYSRQRLDERRHAFWARFAEYVRAQRSMGTVS